MKRPFVWISTQDWDDGLWTRKHRFAASFAQLGHPVLYVDAPVHLLSYARRFPASLSRLRRALGAPIQVAPGLHRLTPLPLLPWFQRFDAINEVDARLLLSTIRSGVRSLGFRDPIVWAYPPHVAPVLEGLDRRLGVYDCVDEWSSFTGLLSPDVVRRQEQRLIRAVDLLLVTSDSLHASKASFARRAAVVPNAADAEHFSAALDPRTVVPEDLCAIPGPRIGFLGALQYWIDFGLLAEVARAFPAASLVLLGPVCNRARPDELRTLRNVHFLGLKPYALLPAYLKGLDVCLSPFLLDETSANVSPLKVFEYLAAGRSVVSVDLPAVRPFGDVVRIAPDRAAFVSAVAQALEEQATGRDLKRREAALDLARVNTWSSRFDRVVELLGDALR